MRRNEFVLDSYAILAFLQKEPGYGRVEALLKGAISGEGKVYVSTINLAEVHYHVLRCGRDASRILAALEALPLKVVSADEYMSQAVEIKAKYGLSFGNCFAAALAQELQTPLITGHRDFRKMGNAVNIEWLG
ncbi:MAG: type II toxin-antitoxin system VapC family toxin [Armatimonadota bacterium]|nr:type II toxin-antitoxin system VapC family toxin [bacterium]